MRGRGEGAHIGTLGEVLGPLFPLVAPVQRVVTAQRSDEDPHGTILWGVHATCVVGGLRLRGSVVNIGAIFFPEGRAVCLSSFHSDGLDWHREGSTGRLRWRIS